jgi:hypothetical protein
VAKLINLLEHLQNLLWRHRQLMSLIHLKTWG